MRSNQPARGRQLGIMLLAYQLAMFGLDKIPPVTLALIGGMVAIFMGFVPALDPYYRTCWQYRKFSGSRYFWKVLLLQCDRFVDKSILAKFYICIYFSKKEQMLVISTEVFANFSSDKKCIQLSIQNRLIMSEILSPTVC